MSDPSSRANRLDRAIAELLAQAPEVEAAAVVSFDGLPMASALPATMDEDRVAAMSAALLSLGERAAEGLGRGSLSQVYIEGEHGTVFLCSADDEAVLVAVASKGAKVGMMLYEVRRAAEVVAEVLRTEAAVPTQTPVEAVVPAATVPVYETVGAAPVSETTWDAPAQQPVAAVVPEADTFATVYSEPSALDTPSYTQPAEPTRPSYLPTSSTNATTAPTEQTPWA